MSYDSSMTARASWSDRLSAERAVPLGRVFGLDLRALAALRILSALLLLVSLGDRARDFTAFYTDTGVLAAADARNGARFEPWDGVSWLHPFSVVPDPWGSVALFTLAAIAAIFLLVGRQTKIAGFLCWSMLTGIDNRNPLVLDAGDDILRLLLFWGLFLPLSARFSVDARSFPPARSNRILSAGTVAFLVQLALIYSMSALFKSYRDWVTDRSAVYYALHLEQFATPLGIALRDHVPSRLLALGTWWLELVSPLLLFSPFATNQLRYLLFVSFAAMHTGIGLTLGIGLFSCVCVAAWLVTLPSGFWDRVEQIVTSLQKKPYSPATKGIHSVATSRGVGDLLAAFFLGYVLLWNLWVLNPGTHGTWFPFAARWLGYQLRLGQLWGMFSPAPSKVSSWLELGAQTLDGRVVWLRPDGRPNDGQRATPERVLSERWRKFQERVVQEQGSGLDERYAAFLLERFEHSAGGAPARVTVVWVTKETPPPTSREGGPHGEDLHLLATAGLQLEDPIPSQNQAYGKSANRPLRNTTELMKDTTR